MYEDMFVCVCEWVFEANTRETESGAHENGRGI